MMASQVSGIRYPQCPADSGGGGGGGGGGGEEAPIQNLRKELLA